jgi:hypothetical protein
VSLSPSEVERGWVEYHCDLHGFLVAMSPRASVQCRCGKQARRLRHGRIVDPVTLKPTDAKPRELKQDGSPFLHRCNACGGDFGGTTALRRHRVGRGARKRCLTAAEMSARGWHLNSRGRWSRPEPRTELSRSEAFSGHEIALATEEATEVDCEAEKPNG